MNDEITVRIEGETMRGSILLNPTEIQLSASEGRESTAVIVLPDKPFATLEAAIAGVHRQQQDHHRHHCHNEWGRGFLERWEQQDHHRHHCRRGRYGGHHHHHCRNRNLTDTAEVSCCGMGGDT